MTTPEVQLSTEWERPALTTEEGSATLMIRIVAPVLTDRAAAARSAVDLAFVIDRSGSMSGRPIELAKQAVSQAIGMLDSRDRAALVVYDDRVDLLHRLSAVDARTRNELRAALARVDARGSTNLCDGWLTGCRELARHEAIVAAGASVRRAILLTDGLANQGETSSRSICQHATELRQRGISTTTLGMGQEFDDALLSGMAEAGGGSYVYVDSAAQLAHTFERELGRLTTTTATRLNLRLELPDGLHGELLNRFPVDRKGHRFDIAIDDLATGDEIVLVFEVRGHGLRLGDRLPVELSVRWTDPLSGDRQTQSGRVMPLDVVDDGIYATMPRFDEVVAQTAILRASNRQREAMALDRAGRHAESRALHSAAFDLLASAPLESDDLQMLDDARSYAAFDADTGFSEHARKQAAFVSFNRSRRRRVATE